MFASSGDAAKATDDDYGTAWSPDGASGWLALDLSSEPTQDRGSVILAWFTSPDDGYSVSEMQGVCPVWPGRRYLSDYVVEVNAAGSGPVPESGWVKAASVTNNTGLSGQHVVDFDGYNWIRLRGSGPNGLQVNVDVADAEAIEGDGWLFLGASVTSAWAGHAPLVGPDGAEVDAFTNLVGEATEGRYLPLTQNAGTACAKASGALVWVDPILDAFPGRYVTLNFGGNEGWGGTGDAIAFLVAMRSLVDKVVTRGKVPIVPKLLWPNNGGQWEAGIEKFNEQIDQLYAQRPEVLPGPDQYELTWDQPQLFMEAGNVHPNEQGSALLRAAWADWAVRVVYDD